MLMRGSRPQSRPFHLTSDNRQMTANLSRKPTPGRGLSPAGGSPVTLLRQLADSAFMNVRQLKEFCSRLSGANETLYGEPSNFLVYSVGGKTFAYFKTSNPEKWRFSTKVTLDRFIELTDFSGAKPARYRGRFHWVTIVDVPRFPAPYLAELVEWSYQRAFASLSKAKQTAIRASNA
jgi:predicted DNA-binding protein (MmcQ/YjbR family)